MSKELVIASNRHETKVAILEDDQLVEVYFQRSNEYSLAGSIHKGRVTRVLPGMQSAFVDLGLERDTFLYVSDFFEENEDIDTVPEDKGNRRDRAPNDARRERGEPRPAMIARPIEIHPPAEPAAVFSVPEEIPVLAEPVIASEVTAPAEGAPFRQDNNDRGRRGRRSRRRRPRPGGFPDNKYAQASSITASEPVNQAEAEGDDDAEDVTPIILPGESLAKYRHSGGTPQEAHPRAEARSYEEPEAAFLDPVDADGMAERRAFTEEEEAEEAAIEERADELEISDKVLSHHFDERPPVEEEKIEEVRHDQPAPVSPFLVGDIEEEQAEQEFEPQVHSAELREQPHVESLRLHVSDAGSFAYEDTPAASELIEGMSSAERGSQVEIGRALPAFDEEFAEEEIAHAPELEDEEALDVVSFDGADLEDVVTFEETDAASEPAGTETAAPEGRVEGEREQGDRQINRGSRRMRRRRGGNRFGNQRTDQPQRAEQTQRDENLPLQGAVTATAAGAAARPEPRREPEPRAERPDRILPSITDLLKPGQELIVQIAKEPLGQKGARITSHVALPGRYVVFMPSVSHLGVSRKVESEEERMRLKRILQAHRPGTTGGFIVRTAGEGVPEEEIAADMDFLYKLWLDIRQKAEKKPAPLLLHCDLDVVQRILRDQVTEDFKAIWTDNEDMYESVLGFVQRFQPTLVGRVKMYTRQAPIFDAFNITQELEKALRPKVWLKSGGYIVINQTEALVAIDINTGKYVGKSNRLEDTIVKTNTEAVKEIVRQIRLRDLGGIIVVDFIDMDERKNRQKVMQALEEAMQADKAPYKILQFNDFGLVAITRKRVKQSLERTLCAPCPYCEGAGYVKSVQTIIGEILIEAQKIRKAIDSKDVLLRVHPDVAKVLKASDNRFLEELEEILGRPVLVKGDPALHHEKFDLG